MALPADRARSLRPTLTNAQDRSAGRAADLRRIQRACEGLLPEDFHCLMEELREREASFEVRHSQQTA